MADAKRQLRVLVVKGGLAAAQAKAARDEADHLAGWAEAVQALESKFMAELEAEFGLMCQERRQTREQTLTKHLACPVALPGKKNQSERRSEVTSSIRA